MCEKEQTVFETISDIFCQNKLIGALDLSRVNVFGIQICPGLGWLFPTHSPHIRISDVADLPRVRDNLIGSSDLAIGSPIQALAEGTCCVPLHTVGKVSHLPTTTHSRNNCHHRTMGDKTLSRGVQSTLDELSYLSLQHDDLVVEDNSQIGAGGYGEVLLAKLRKSELAEVEVAVKCLWAVGTMGDRQRFATRFTRELKIWSSVRHLNVLPLFGFYLSNDYKIAQLISPFLANGNVTQYISRTNADLEKRFDFVRDITAGIDFLHKHCPPICHGDLKPANVLVTNSHEAALCDFGLASLAEDSVKSSGLTTSRSIKGSTRYMSPELLLETNAKHARSSDVWAWACTTFEILTDRIPYLGADGEHKIIVAMLRKEAPVGGEKLDEVMVGRWGTTALRRLQPLLFSVSTSWSFSPVERPGTQDIMYHAFPSVVPRYRDAHNGMDYIGSVHVLIHRSVHCKDGPRDLVGPQVRAMLNGVCQDTTRFQDTFDKDDPAIFEIEVGSLREVVVLEAVYFPDGTERILGRAEICVRDIVNSSFSHEEHRYAIQKPEGFVVMEYRSGFLAGTVPAQIHKLQKDVPYSTPLPAGHPWAEALEDFALLRSIPPAQIHESRMNSGRRGSISSEAQSFYTAPTHFSVESQPSIPGGLREFYRSFR